MVNLSGLNILTAIGGSLVIGKYNWAQGVGLTTLEGLENLISIGGDLSILDGDYLTSLKFCNPTRHIDITYLEEGLYILQIELKHHTV